MDARNAEDPDYQTLLVGTRLVEFRGELGQNQTQLATSLGVHTNTLGRYERGERLPDGDLLLGLVKLGLNTHWLMTGDGPMFIAKSQQAAHSEMILAASGDPAALEAREARHAGFSAGVEFERSRFEEQFALIPLLNIRAKAGVGYENPQPEILGHRAFERSWLLQEGLSEKYLRLVMSDGHSMAPTIGHRWIVMLDESRTNIVHDGIYVLWTPPPGGTIIKRVDVDAVTGDVSLISDSDPQGRRLVRRDELPQLKVAGRAVWWAPGRAFI